VVDLDEVAKSVGAAGLLADMVKMRETNLNNEFGKISNELKDELQSKLDDVKSEFGTEVPAEEAKKLQQQTITANAKLQQFRNQAQANLNVYTEQLKQQFRAEVRPIAQEVAAKKGFAIVIPKNEGLLLSVEPGHDITNDVILALQARNSKTAPAVKPAAEAKPQTETTASKPTKKKSTESSPKKTTSTKEIDER
jgi:Skp family chaperone for outer membrane proteins